MKIPPYGKPLKELLQSGQKPSNSVYLYIGKDGWKKAENTFLSRPTRTMLLPNNHRASDYDWPVSGCDILIIETSPLTDQYIEDVVQTLFIQGAIKVTLISVDFSTVIYEKDF